MVGHGERHRRRGDSADAVFRGMQPASGEDFCMPRVGANDFQALLLYGSPLWQFLCQSGDGVRLAQREWAVQKQCSHVRLQIELTKTIMSGGVCRLR